MLRTQIGESLSRTADQPSYWTRLVVGALIWIGLAVPAAAAPAPVFGPENFVRETEEPLTESRTFSTTGFQGPFLLQLQNGGADGSFGRVSSALVTLNGEVVFGPRDFNQTVELLKREVLLEPDNELTVEVRSIPGTGFTLTVLGEPAGPPQVQILTPESGLVTSADSVQVSGVLFGFVEAIEVNGIAAALDGTSFAAEVPLEEGTNRLVATATNRDGDFATDAVSVRRDTTPPLVVIETPRDGDRLVGEVVTVAGTVNDIIPGATVNEDDVTVTVNGQPAPVMNRTFLVPDLPLELGDNTLTAVAVDRVGNTGTASIVVSREPDLAGIRIVITGGNNQRGLIGSPLPEPLSVRILDPDGQPITGRPLTFTVSRGDGLLGDPVDGLRGRTLLSSADGTASTSFQLGSRSGEGFHRVRVTTPGSLSFAELCATAEPAPPATISITRAPPTRGMVGRPLTEPLSVIVNDSGGNGVPGVPVTFRVELGGGSFSGQKSVEILTDPDGIAEAEWTLGPDPGTANNEAAATFPDNPGLSAVFTASGFATGPPEETTVEGVVQNSAGEPLVGARAVLRGTDLEAFTGPDGRFVIEDVPPGGHHVGILGGFADEPGRDRFYPDIEFAIEAIAGAANELDQVVVLPFLDLAGAKLVGGDEDVILEMEGVPGFAIKVFAHSVILPDGSRGEVLMSSSQVKFDKVPMPPPQGSTPLVVGTLQPAGIRFDPPAQVTYPNVEGLAPGDVADIFTFHHDIGQFVNAGPGTVTEDGSVVVSDPGFGIVQSGWHCLIRIPGPAANCANDCRVQLTSDDAPITGTVMIVVGESKTVTVEFSPSGSLEGGWTSGDSAVATVSGEASPSGTLTGAAKGSTTITTPTNRVPVPDQEDKTCEAEFPVEVMRPEIKLEKEGTTTIEAGNNYSENTTLKATVIFPAGHPMAGQTVTGFNQVITFSEETGTSYYDGIKGATSLPMDVTPSDGVATLTIKSVSNANSTSGPPDAMIRATAMEATEQGATNPLSVNQWVDENSNGFIDWLQDQSQDILSCFQGKTGVVGAVARSVTRLVQDTSANCGTTQVRTTTIQISPTCGTASNVHRLNDDNQLSATVLHEARHAWVNQELTRNDVGTDDDGNSTTPSNDDDQDRWAEVLGGFPDANDIIEAASPSMSDNAPDPSPTNNVQEKDAEDFALTHRKECP